MEKTTIVTTPKFLTKTVADGAVDFVLGNGQSIKVRLADLPVEMQTRLALHGLSQKVGDSTASCSKDNAFGAAFAAMDSVVTALKAGNWGVEREPSGQLDLIEAIAQLKKMDKEAVAAAVYAATPEQVKAWLKNAKIAALVLDIKAKRAKAKAKESEEEFDFEV